MFNHIFDVKLEKEEIVPAGKDYVLSIDSVEPHTFKNGNPALRVTFRVVGAPQEGLIDKKVVEFFPTSGKGQGFLVKFLKACGIDTSREKFSVQGDDFLGKQVVANVVHEEFQGQVRARVRDPRPKT